MATGHQPPDEELQAAVVAAANVLTAAVERAWEAGLVVKVGYAEVQEVEGHLRPFLTTPQNEQAKVMNRRLARKKAKQLYTLAENLRREGLDYEAMAVDTTGKAPEWLMGRAGRRAQDLIREAASTETLAERLERRV
jgi:hypothetical protein